MTIIFSRRFRKWELVADAAALVMSLALPIITTTSRSQWDDMAFSAIWFGPGVWFLVRLMPAVRRLTNAQLRQDLAMTPSQPRAILRGEVLPRVVRALIPTALIIPVLITVAVIDSMFNSSGSTTRLFLLMWIPLIVVWIVDQVMLAAMILMTVMLALLRRRQKGNEAFWFGGALLGLAGLLVGISWSAVWLLNTAGLGAMLIPLVLLMGFPFVIAGRLRSQWERIVKQYFVID